MAMVFWVVKIARRRTSETTAKDIFLAQGRVHFKNLSNLLGFLFIITFIKLVAEGSSGLLLWSYTLSAVLCGLQVECMT